MNPIHLTTLRLVALSGLAFFTSSASLRAVTYTWDGTTNLWNSAHWSTIGGGGTLVAGPTGNSNANSANISAGTVTFANNDTFGNDATTSSPVVTVNSGGTLASGARFNTIWGLNLSGGTIALTGGVNATFPAFQFAGTLTATGTSNINVVSGTFNIINIGGSGNGTLNMNVVGASDVLNVNAPLQNNTRTTPSSLTKSGLGTLNLSAANTYTGATTVTGGKLTINGSITSAVTVQTGATLQGSGTITGNVTVQGNGTLAAGNSIESLRITGNLTHDAGSILAYEIDKSAAATLAGDLTAVTGNFNLALANNTILTIAELGGSGTWNLNEKLTLASYTGAWNGGLFNYNSVLLSDDSTFTFSGATWRFNYNDLAGGTNYIGDTTGAVGFVTMTVIPEPRTALLGCLGALLFLRRRR